MYRDKGKSLTELPPSSLAIHGHLLRCKYAYKLASSLLDSDQFFLKPIEYGWQDLNSVLFPEKLQRVLPKEYMTVSGCQKGCTGRCKYKKSEFGTCTDFCKCNNSCT